MPKKRRAKRTPPQTPENRDTLHLVEYEVTSEPILDRDYKRLPRQVKEAIERFHEMIRRQPREAIPELRKWIKRYPNVPVFYNYLSVAYSRVGQGKKAKAVILENYEQNPDYLFARLNYAELCLARRDYEAVAEIFEHKFDLKLLYPERNRFHVTEVASFMGLIGIYFFETGERELAERYYEVVRQVDRNHPMVKNLQRTLFPNLLQRVWRRLVGQRQ